MAKEVNLETYETICKNRFDVIEKGLEDNRQEIAENRRAINKISNKVFNGFGDQIESLKGNLGNLNNAMDKLMSLILWFIVVAGIAGASSLINIVLRLIPEPP